MDRTRRRLGIWAAGLAALAGLGQPGLAEAGPPTFDGVLDATFAVTRPVALTGGVVTRQGLAWSGVRGVRGVRGGGQPDAAEPGDRWHLGSNAKAFTAAAFARLVKRGAARWGLPLGEALPDLPMDPAWRGATVEALLRHRAGLRDEPVLERAWLARARDDPRPLPAQRRALAAAALARPPGGAPGAFAYANLNYVVAGAAIEALAGTSWEEVMATEVFAPLGLERAGFGAPVEPAPWGHRRVSGLPLAVGPADPASDNPPAMGPAGTVHMAAADYGRALRPFLGDGGGGWLSSDSVARLTAAEGSYALGWGVAPAPPEGPLADAGPLLAHEGSNTLWHAIVVLSPGAGMGAFAFSNDGGRGADATRGLVRGLLTLVAQE